MKQRHPNRSMVAPLPYRVLSLSLYGLQPAVVMKTSRPSAKDNPASKKFFAIKAAISDPSASVFNFAAQKTMYGGKLISAGDEIFLFASENEGGAGLIASGIVITAELVPKAPGIARQTPRVSITVKRQRLADRHLGRSELKPFSTWDDGQPTTELNFKFYRQATNKIVGISDAAAAFLRERF